MLFKYLFRHKDLLEKGDHFTSFSFQPWDLSAGDSWKHESLLFNVVPEHLLEVSSVFSIVSIQSYIFQQLTCFGKRSFQNTFTFSVDS